MYHCRAGAPLHDVGSLPSSNPSATRGLEAMLLALTLTGSMQPYQRQLETASQTGTWCGRPSRRCGRAVGQIGRAQPRSLVERVRAQIFQIYMLQCANMGGIQPYRAGESGFQRFRPARRAHTPTIARLQPGEAELRAGR